MRSASTCRFQPRASTTCRLSPDASQCERSGTTSTRPRSAPRRTSSATSSSECRAAAMAGRVWIRSSTGLTTCHTAVAANAAPSTASLRRSRTTAMAHSSSTPPNISASRSTLLPTGEGIR
ncbi:hypothetical protein [Actinomadura keratinilytica]|uniref:hypothetical protein n=1 Tax=Actinomadura keratinilytica TaxID=547461 RepID=UPI00360B7AB7